MKNAPAKWTAEDFEKEVFFKMSTSSGNGGQHVNRVATKAALHFNPANSAVLTDEQKAIVLKKWATKLTKAGVLIITRQKSRSAEKNRSKALKELIRRLQKALEPTKKRKKTSISLSDREARLKAKKRKSDVKRMREKPSLPMDR